jgi:hypothetical protein
MDLTKATGWGRTKRPTPQRDQPKLHYFVEGRSVCHGTKPIEIIANSAKVNASSHPDACPTCIAKKRTIDGGRSRKGGAHVR